MGGYWVHLVMAVLCVYLAREGLGWVGLDWIRVGKWLVFACFAETVCDWYCGHAHNMHTDIHKDTHIYTHTNTQI